MKNSFAFFFSVYSFVITTTILIIKRRCGYAYSFPALSFFFSLFRLHDRSFGVPGYPKGLLLAFGCLVFGVSNASS